MGKSTINGNFQWQTEVTGYSTSWRGVRSLAFQIFRPPSGGVILSCRSSKSGLYASVCKELVTSLCPDIWDPLNFMGLQFGIAKLVNITIITSWCMIRKQLYLDGVFSTNKHNLWGPHPVMSETKRLTIVANHSCPLSALIKFYAFELDSSKWQRHMGLSENIPTSNGWSSSGWWFQPTPLKNDGVKVRLDHHPNYWGK